MNDFRAVKRTIYIRGWVAIGLLVATFIGVGVDVLMDGGLPDRWWHTFHGVCFGVAGMGWIDNPTNVVYSPEINTRKSHGITT